MMTEMPPADPIRPCLKLGWGLLPTPVEPETRARRMLFWLCAAAFVFLFGWAAWRFNVPAHAGIDQNGYLVGGRMVAETGTMKIAPRRLDDPSQVDPHQFVGGMWVGAECGTDRERFYPKYPIGLPLLFAGTWRATEAALGNWPRWAVPVAIVMAALLAGAWLVVMGGRRYGVGIPGWICRWLRRGTVVALVAFGAMALMFFLRRVAGRYAELGYLPGPTLAFWVSPVCAVASVVAAYKLMRLVCSSYLAFLGTAVYATSPVTLLLMTNPNSHASTVCCVAWGIYFLIAFWRFEGIWRAFFAGFFLAYAMTIRYTEATLLLPLALVACFYLRLGRRLWWLVSFEWWRSRAARRSSPVMAGEAARAGWWASWGRQWTGGLMLFVGWAVPAGFLFGYNKLAMGTWTGYDPTNESVGFAWEFARDNWETMLRHMNTNGVFMFFGIGLVGMIWMFWVNWRLASVLASWIVPCLLIYTFYYWAPDNQQNNMAIHIGYLRFFLTIIPGVVLCAMWLLGRLAKLAEGPAPAGPAWYQRWPRALELNVVMLPVLASLWLMWFGEWVIAVGVGAATVIWLIALLARLGESGGDPGGGRRSVLRWQKLLELLIAALPSLVGVALAARLEHHRYVWVMAPPLVVWAVWVIEWLGEQGQIVAAARRLLLREAGLWTVPLAVAAIAAMVFELKFDEWSLTTLVGLGASAGLAVSIPLFGRRLPVSLCAGVLAALALAVHLENATNGLESDHYNRLNLALNTNQVLRVAPRGSVIFCNDTVFLHNLQFERDYLIYTGQTFNAGSNKGLGNRINMEKVQYFDPSRTKAMYERLKDYDQRQLEDQRREIVINAVAAGRKVFVVDRGARQRDANSPAKPRTLAQQMADVSGPKITPLYTDLVNFWRFSNVPKADDDDTTIKRREGNRRARPGPRGDGGGTNWWMFELSTSNFEKTSEFTAMLAEREARVKVETDRRLAMKAEQDKRDRERREVEEKARREQVEADRKRREEAEKQRQETLAQRRAEVADLTKRHAAALADANKINAVLDKARQDQKVLEQALSKLNAETVVAQQGSDRAVADRQAAEAALAKATAATAAAQLAKAEADKSLAAAHDAAKAAAAERTALQKALEQLKAEQAQLHKEIEKARAEKAVAEKAAAEARAKVPRPIPPSSQPATREMASP